MGAGSAFWSAAIFASSFLLLLGGHMIRMDMMLTAAAVFAWLAVVRFHASGRGRDLAAFWAFTALALATKGPIALLFTVAPAFVWFGWERRLAGLRSLWPLTGLAALAAGVGAWVWAVVQSGNAEYLDTIWNRQLVGRAINSWSHKEPFYYYLALLPFLLLPWTALVASGARQLHRDRPSYWKPIAVFTIVPFVTLSMVSEKLPIYLLPMMPGVALVAAHAATRLAAQPRAALAYLLAPALFFVLLATGLAWGVWNHAPALRTPGLVLAAVFAAGAVAVVAFGRGDGRRALAVTLGSALATSWLVFGLMSWLANPLFSARELAGALARHAPGDTPVATVRVNRGILNYYAARLYDELDPEETRAWMTAHPNGMVIVKTAEARRVFGAGGVPASCRVHEVYRITFKDYHVIAGC
jgi:4-amino-4-deoxy-L-arabinose transferase-like glycosyltransferase